MFLDICTKLNVHFSSFANLAISEKDVIYALVQIRKLIESDDLVSDYRILKFHADWAIHTEKSRFLDSVIPMLRSLGDDKNPLSFANMLLKALKEETSTFCANHKLLDITNDSRIWSGFVSSLISILIDQPIKWTSNSSHRGIIKFSYTKPKNGDYSVYFNIQ